MATDEDKIEKSETGEEETPEEDTSAQDKEETEEKEEKEVAKDEPKEEHTTPAQLGHKRFVYAAYLGGAILVGFLATKIIDWGWFKLSTYKPEIGEAHDEVVVPVAALIGIGTALYYWRKKRIRTLAEEVAEELSKVTWPSRNEVTSSTFVVIVTTLFATVFFALMDQFWLWVTKHVYGT